MDEGILTGEAVLLETLLLSIYNHDSAVASAASRMVLAASGRPCIEMGSRRTHEDRLVRLKEAGLTDEEIARIHSPIGLDLGARTPEEKAISIAAEIVQDRWGGTGTRLKNADGPIHAGAPR